MQSTDLEEIKAALWEQAFHGCTQVVNALLSEQVLPSDVSTCPPI